MHSAWAIAVHFIIPQQTSQVLLLKDRASLCIIRRVIKHLGGKGGQQAHDGAWGMLGDTSNEGH